MTTGPSSLVPRVKCCSAGAGVTDPPAHMGTMNVRPRAVTIVEIHRVVEPVPVPRTRRQTIHLGPTTQRRIVVTLPELHLTTRITSLTTREPPRRHRAPRVRELHTERTVRPPGGQEPTSLNQTHRATQAVLQEPTPGRTIELHDRVAIFQAGPGPSLWSVSKRDRTPPTSRGID